MGHDLEENWTRISELLPHISEFIAYFEVAETKMQEWRQDIEAQALRLEQQQALLKTLTERALIQIEQHRDQAIHNINRQLGQYDADMFQKVAYESCEQVQRAALDAVTKSNNLLKMFQIRLNFYAVFTTIITAFIIVLYLNGELPWEMHHKANNERQAGKVLLQAWPKLSKEEKNKILSYIKDS